MQPLGCLIVGLVAAFCFAIGDVFGEVGAGVLAWLGLLTASTPLPDPWRRHKGAWMFYPLLRRPLLMVRGLEFAGLEDDELAAITAHEFGHMTLADRLWRFAGGILGACALPLLVLYLLRNGTIATLSSFLLIAVAGFVAALLQERVIVASERRADALAIELQGTDIHLLSAKLKLHLLAPEQHGLYAHEQGQSERALQATYLRELGGPSAIPWLLQPARSLGAARPIDGGMSEWMTLEGQFVAGLVDGRRSVRDIVDAAKAQKSVAEFAAIRLLHQLMKKGVIVP